MTAIDALDSTIPGRPRARSWVVLAGLAATGLFLSVLDQTITGIGYSPIQKDFGVDNVDIQWVTTAYRVSQGVVVPIGVWAVRRFGLRRMYLVSMVLYIVTSTLCGTSRDLGDLVAYRVLQAIPGGLSAIASVALLVAALPPARAATGQAIMMATVLSAPGFSPLLGGLLVDHSSWRTIFFVTVGVALVALIGSAVLLPPLPTGGPLPFDWAGFLSIATALATLVLAMSKGSDWGWTSYPVLILFTVSVDALALFVIVERQSAHPLLDHGVFGSQPYVVGLVVCTVVISSTASVPTFVPRFLENVQDLTATTAGLVLAPQAVALLLAVPVAGLLMKVVGVRWCLALGLTVLACGMLTVQSILTVDLPRWHLAAVLAGQAFGLGLALVPALGAPIAILPPTMAPSGVAFRTMVQRIGSESVLLALTAHSSHRSAQILVDRSQLLPPSDAPALHQVARTAPGSLLGQYQEQAGHDTAQAYSEVFQYLGVLVLATVVLAVVGRWGEKLPTVRDVMDNGA